MKCPQNEVERNRHGGRDQRHQKIFARTQAVDLYFGAVPAVRIFQPCDERIDRHGRRHAHVGDHLAVIGDDPGNDAVQHGKDDDEHLADGISLGAEDQGRHADERCGQGQKIHPVPDAERGDDQKDGPQPESELRLCKVMFFHKTSLHAAMPVRKKSVRSTLPSKT